MLVTFAASLAVTLASHAQVSIQASVDRPVVRDNESFTFTVRAEGALRGEPEEGPLAESFDILGRSSSSRVQILNGRTSQVTEWQYQLMPKSTGEFLIPPLHVADAQTNPVSVRVLPPDTSTGGAAADVFIELEADPENAYVQSQVVLTLRLFIGVTTGRATLTVPETGGMEAIVEKLGDDSSYQTTRGGRTFIVRERRYAVFPQAAGKLTLGPATFEAMVIPDRGFSRVQRFRSDMITVDVQPAVAPPASMAGAAWLPSSRVTLSEEWSDSSNELAVGVPRTRKIVIEGAGLLETQLPDLDLGSQTGVRQYADQPELTREITPDGLVSKRSVSLAVIAQSPGQVTLGGIRLPWWNVNEKRWEVAELPPRALTIAPSRETPAPASEPQTPATSVAPAPAATSGYWPYVGAGLALGWLATLFLWWRASRAARGAGSAAAADAARRPTLRKVRRDLDSACTVGDAEGARLALLAYAELKFPDAPPRSLGALAAVLPEPVGREVLALEAHIYGSATGVWDGEELKLKLRTLDATQDGASRSPDEPLLPLYR